MFYRAALLGCLAVGGICYHTLAVAQTTGTVKITYLENGWFGEGLAFKVSGSGVSGCPAPDIEFAVPQSHPAYREIQTLLVSAFVAKQNIEVVPRIGTCGFGNRTLIHSVRLVE